jgi:TPP-dependent pyruvate/acetoin dehydrogenase alpha subunit
LTAESSRQRETFQKTLRAMKSSLDDKDEAMREKEESNSVLRRDLMEMMAKFGWERAAMERRLAEDGERLERTEGELAERTEDAKRDAIHQSIILNYVFLYNNPGDSKLSILMCAGLLMVCRL